MDQAEITADDIAAFKALAWNRFEKTLDELTWAELFTVLEEAQAGEASAIAEIDQASAHLRDRTPPDAA